MSVQALSCAMVIRGVSASEKLLLLVLANYADDKMTCWPSHRRLSADSCLSERTVLTLLKSLEAKHMISRELQKRPDGSRSSDVITLHFSGEVISPRPAIDGRRWGSDFPTPRNHVGGGGEMVSPLTTFEPSSEPIDDDPIAQRVDWNERFEEAKAVGGEGLNLTVPAMHTYRDLKALCEPSTGEPCEWDEVLDAIRVTTAKAKQTGNLVRSWTWIAGPALGFRDRRLAGLPDPQRQTQPAATGPPASFSAQLGADQAEARRLAFAMMDNENG